MYQKNLKLTIELVPQTVWFKNVRHAVDENLWNEIRRAVYKKYNHRCAICDARGRLNCHEVWEYDDAQHVQRLVDFVALCDLCHHVKHIGLAGVLSQRGKLDFSKVVEHFMKVNECTETYFWKCYDEAFALWEERSHYEWQIDLSRLHHLIAKLRG